MSWDVLIMKHSGQLRSQDLPDEFNPEPLGDADEVRSKLSEFFGGVCWDDPAWGVFDGDGFSYEFNFKEAGAVDAFTLHVHGSGDPVSPIVAMCKHFGWQALDYSAGEFIELESPTSDTWMRFQKYTDRVPSTDQESRR